MPLKSRVTCGSKRAIKSFEIEPAMAVMSSVTLISSSSNEAANLFLSKISTLVLTYEIELMSDWKAKPGPVTPYPFSS